MAASAAAAREAAAAGNGEIMPATSLFVRKVMYFVVMTGTIDVGWHDIAVLDTVHVVCRFLANDSFVPLLNYLPDRVAGVEIGNRILC